MSFVVSDTLENSDPTAIIGLNLRHSRLFTPFHFYFFNHQYQYGRRMVILQNHLNLCEENKYAPTERVNIVKANLFYKAK